jgi:cardiolipin synthase (CMP-forming)
MFNEGDPERLTVVEVSCCGLKTDRPSENFLSVKLNHPPSSRPGNTMPLSLANKITFLRLFCIPFFILLLLYYDRGGGHNETLRIVASIIFIVTFLFDGIDGYIARTRNQITRLGTIIDPLADKALMLSGLVLLSYSSVNTYHNHLPIWFVWLVISRDTMLVVGAIVIHLLTGNVTVKPRISGKLTTFFQTFLIAWVMLNLPKGVFNWVLGAATFLTSVSGIQYFLDGVRQIDIKA